MDPQMVDAGINALQNQSSICFAFRYRLGKRYLSSNINNDKIINKEQWIPKRGDKLTVGKKGLEWGLSAWDTFLVHTWTDETWFITKKKGVAGGSRGKMTQTKIK